MFNACRNQPSITLLSSRTIDFPAASGIEMYRDTLYVFGDNATHLLMLSPAYQPLRQYSYWQSNETVIDKDEKPDIESAMIVIKNNQPVLIGMGSLSTEKRWVNFEFPLGADSFTRSSFFPKGTTFPDIKELNIEGCTAFGEGVVFCNRANLETKQNHLLFKNSNGTVEVKEIKLPKTQWVAGISGLYYVPEEDLLLFTASEEATTSAYQDGAIGESYLGWIERFSNASKNKILEPNAFLKLSGFDKKFTQQKIESVCVEKKQGNTFLLHLAADNDDGKSVLFKVKLTR
jgi:hypothetical protein